METLILSFIISVLAGLLANALYVCFRDWRR